LKKILGLNHPLHDGGLNALDLVGDI